MEFPALEQRYSHGCALLRVVARGPDNSKSVLRTKNKERKRSEGQGWMQGLQPEALILLGNSGVAPDGFLTRSWRWMMLSLVVEGGKRSWTRCMAQPRAEPCTEHSRGLFPYLQFSRGHLEHQLDDTAHGQASGAGRVHLVPDGVTVDLVGTHRDQVRSREGSQEPRD